MMHHGVCQCGALTIEASDNPDVVVACNCKECQRRTGAPFGVGAYFKQGLVNISGDYQSWTRTAPSGRKLTNHFCPKCGTNLFWSLEMRPEHFGVALGCLSTDVGEPARAIWTAEKLDWVEFPNHWPTFEGPTPI